MLHWTTLAAFSGAGALGVLTLRIDDDNIFALRSRSARCWAVGAILLDGGFALLAIFFSWAAVGDPAGWRALAPILVGIGLPSALKLPIRQRDMIPEEKRSGPAWMIYPLLRYEVEDRFINAVLSDRSRQVNNDVEEARRLGLKPRHVASQMEDWVNGHKRLRGNNAKRLTQIRGALTRDGKSAQLERLFWLIDEYRLTGLRRELLGK